METENSPVVNGMEIFTAVSATSDTPLATKIPSTIVEVGYLSNKKDLKTIIKESGQNAIAQGISDGIIQALEGNR